ncbi:MAG TPA: ABC transporter ATP-binding protein [Candidatus Saccharimonadia bacterium]|nr:ABC transporter ATP-binding protein [Candidatus Saccharimonadia bacterium]
MDKVAIKVDHISKAFKLPHERQSSIKGALINIFKGGVRSYETQHVLQNVSFDIKKGEFFGIVGRNGSGKSTMLKMLAGIYIPTEGSITVNGKLTPFIELGVGFNPELTGRENVYLNGALLGFSRKEMNALYDDIVAFAELERFMDQKLKNYSSGMQVRLAFSIAIKVQTDILLLDEVLAVGDQNFQEKCFDYFENIKRSDTTVILISHDASVIERFCSRVAIIDRGKLVNIGPAKEMVLQYGAIMAEEQYEQGFAQDKGKRQGNGALTLKNIRVTDASGKTCHSLQASERFAIMADYVLNTKLSDEVIVGVDIIDHDGDSILGPNTAESLKSGLQLQKRGTIAASFDMNPLSPGMYSITVGVFNKRATYAYDLIEGAVRFKIIGERRHGKIYIEPRWTIS